jgi:hypothetical protein
MFWNGMLKSKITCILILLFPQQLMVKSVFTITMHAEEVSYLAIPEIVATLSSFIVSVKPFVGPVKVRPIGDLGALLSSFVNL